MLEQLTAGFLPDSLYRDVSDFGDGTTLYIPTLGETVIRDYSEDSDVQMDPIDTGQVTLTITNYVSGGSYVTDKLKDDAYKAAVLEASIAPQHLRLIKERVETDQHKVIYSAQTASDPNNVNGFNHRWVAGSTATLGVFSLDDLLYAKLALDEANAPEEGRICIVPPIVEASINKQIAGQAYSYNPQFQGLFESGMSKAGRFMRSIFGFDIYVNTRCHVTTGAETIVGFAGSKASAAGYRACLIGCFGDDMVKPVMGAWRRMPSTEGFRNASRKRDEYTTTARWGFGAQRTDTAITVLVHPTTYV
jgi:hypothetical protein